MNTFKISKTLASIAAILALIVSAAGLFWKDGGASFYVTSIYGEKVELYGNGLYAYDTYFKAPIQIGTDAVTLFIAVPILIIMLWLNKRDVFKYKLLLVGVLSFFMYNSASLAFGVSYNKLFMVYILYFSATLFSFVAGIMSIASENISNRIMEGMPRKSIAVFMIITGLSVFVWFIEILGALTTGKPPASLAIYTTEPTYIFDLAIIAPSCFAGSVLLFRRKPTGYLFAAVLMVLSSFIGLVVIAQTINQKLAGVSISAGQFIAFVGVFIVISLAGIYLNIKLLKNIRS
jgi:hypothetical protein